jgi:GMP synthase PP-ATPase subunit
VSEGITIALITLIASAISVGVTSLVTYLINKNKVQPEINQIKADTSLTGGELAAKYQTIANTQADANIELAKDNMELKKQIEVLTNDVEELKRSRIADREEFRKTFEEERERNQKILEEERARADKFENYNNRLIFQLKSWEIIPVPYSLDEFKESKKNCIDGAEVITK